MYEVQDIQDYKQKWLEAERDLAVNWVEPPSLPLNHGPIGNVDKDTKRAKKRKGITITIPNRGLYEPLVKS